MMIVDTPGFQNPEQGGSARGASFEELCHNYTQDRLQRLFHERTFVQELERYKEVALDLVSACHTPSPLALTPSGRASADEERKAALLTAPFQLLFSCHVYRLSRLVDFSCPRLHSYFVESLLSKKLCIQSPWEPLLAHLQGTT